MEKIRLCLVAAFRRAGRCSCACSLAVSIAIGIFVGFNHDFAAAGSSAQFSNRDHSLSAYQAAGTRLAAKPPTPVPRPKRADFGGEPKSTNVQRVADWVAHSGDNRGMPFVIVDKVDAKVFVFDAHGRLRGAAPALLGLARGDYSVRGIGDRKLSGIRPGERTTPAGRFVASMGLNAKRKDVLWVDYKNAVSLHRVVTDNPREQRLERLATRTSRDNRISYGCINVPADFFDRFIKPAFNGSKGVVYVLPETRPIGEIFKSYYDVEPYDVESSRWTVLDYTDEPPAARPRQPDLRSSRPYAPLHNRVPAY